MFIKLISLQFTIKSLQCFKTADWTTKCLHLACKNNAPKVGDQASLE